MRNLLLVCFCLIPSSAWSDEISERISAYMDAAVQKEKFVGSVLVGKEGKTLFTKGYGEANAEHHVANSPETKFRLGSITKQFTAMGILILKDQGKIKLDEPIGTYWIDSPKTWEKVTVHHLLTHTSGIPSYTDSMGYALTMTKPETVRSMIDRFKSQPLEFEPGSKFHYDNSGYFLLGAIIEKVSGKTYEEFLKEAIFDPLEMMDSGYDRPETLLVNRASGYDRGPQGLRNARYLDMNQPYAAGSLYSTVGDLQKWHNALQAGKLLTKESYTVMYKPFKNNYAYGWTIETVHGHKKVGHGGGINGFVTDISRYPADDVVIVVLCNVLPANPGKISNDLAAIVFGKTIEPPKERVVAKVDPKLYDEYTGKYEITPNFVLTVTRQGDRLMTQATGQSKLEVFPESDTDFFLKVVDAQLTFVKEEGKVTHLFLKQNGRELKGKRLAD